MVIGRNPRALRLIQELMNGKEGLKAAGQGMGEVGGAHFWGLGGKEGNTQRKVRSQERVPSLRPFFS